MSKVASVLEKDKSQTYWTLAKAMLQKEFVWFVPNDDNRLEDGRLLRYDFIAEEELDADREWMELGCSFLEMLVALSYRLSFEDGQPAEFWFAQLLDNLGLKDCTDASPYPPADIDQVLDTVIWRTYRANGRGGLFPLRRPQQDQREVEIWYQLSAYLIENE